MLVSLHLPVWATDPRIVYVGRFAKSANGEMACQWPASEVRLRVRGSKLVVHLHESGGDNLELAVDGKPAGKLNLSPNQDTYTIDLGTDAVHDVELVKRTEAFVGTVSYGAFDAPGGRIERAHASRKRIEFVGDSITCGFGNEGKNQNEPFTPATENAYMSYAEVAARMVGADATLIAWSGRKMWPDDTMPEIYDRTLPTDPSSTYDFRNPAPQALVINLATNDFGHGNPDEAKWTGAYEAFIRRVWSHYPRTQVYAAIGGMMSDDYPPGQNALTTLRGYLVRMVGRMKDARLHIIEFAPHRAEDGYGAVWHPSLKTHEIMGAKLAEALKRDLRW